MPTSGFSSRSRAAARWLEIGERDAAKLALAAALDANPDHCDALEAFAELCFAEGDFAGAEQSWIRLVRHVTDPARQATIYRRLGDLYDAQLPNPQRAELAYKEVLKREPDDTASSERLVLVYGRLGDVARAVELQTELVNRASGAADKRDRTIQLARVYETIASDKRKAEATLDKARKAYGHDSTLLRAVAEFHQRHGETTAVNVLLDRSAVDARRALATGRFDASFFEILATIAELRENTDAAAVARATLAALEGRGLTLQGAGPAAGDPKLDDLLAPELLSLPLRALLRKAGEALDAAYPVDLRTLRAAPLPSSAADFSGLIRQLADAFSVQAPDLYASPTLGAVCMPVSSSPAILVVGQALLDSTDDAARYFVVVRALKVLQGRAAALSRTAPIDLWPVLAAFLGAFAPSWQPEGIDPRRFKEAQQKITAALPRRIGQRRARSRTRGGRFDRQPRKPACHRGQRVGQSCGSLGDRRSLGGAARGVDGGEPRARTAPERTGAFEVDWTQCRGSRRLRVQRQRTVRRGPAPSGPLRGVRGGG